jgi:hypothetical protein
MAQDVGRQGAETVALNEQEKLFFSRVSIKAAAGASFEDACRAVLADDLRIYSTFLRLNSYDRADLSYKLAHEIYAAAHTRLAAQRWASA